MDFLKKHNVDGEKEFVKMSDFRLLTYGVMMEKGATVPGGDADRLGRKGVGNRLRERGMSGARWRRGRKSLRGREGRDRKRERSRRGG